jgi:hypothetical protein
MQARVNTEFATCARDEVVFLYLSPYEHNVKTMMRLFDSLVLFVEDADLISEKLAEEAKIRGVRVAYVIPNAACKVTGCQLYEKNYDENVTYMIVSQDLEPDKPMDFVRQHFKKCIVEKPPLGFVMSKINNGVMILSVNMHFACGQDLWVSTSRGLQAVKCTDIIRCTGDTFEQPLEFGDTDILCVKYDDECSLLRGTYVYASQNSDSWQQEACNHCLQLQGTAPKGVVVCSPCIGFIESMLNMFEVFEVPIARVYLQETLDISSIEDLMQPPFDIVVAFEVINGLEKNNTHMHILSGLNAKVLAHKVLRLVYLANKRPEYEPPADDVPRCIAADTYRETKDGGLLMLDYCNTNAEQTTASTSFRYAKLEIVKDELILAHGDTLIFGARLVSGILRVSSTLRVSCTTVLFGKVQSIQFEDLGLTEARAKEHRKIIITVENPHEVILDATLASCPLETYEKAV